VAQLEAQIQREFEQLNARLTASGGRVDVAPIGPPGRDSFSP
jgi:hypothetical protein